MFYLAAPADEKTVTPSSPSLSYSMQVHRERELPVISSSLADASNCSTDIIS